MLSMLEIEEKYIISISLKTAVKGGFRFLYEREGKCWYLKYQKKI